jgi:hypothetical protein
MESGRCIADPAGGGCDYHHPTHAAEIRFINVEVYKSQRIIRPVQRRDSRSG